MSYSVKEKGSNFDVVSDKNFITVTRFTTREPAERLRDFLMRNYITTDAAWNRQPEKLREQLLQNSTIGLRFK